MSYSVEDYEAYMVSHLFGPWSSQLIRLANPMPGERILDLACGTGVMARKIASQAEPGGWLLGLDLNSGMLHEARRIAQRKSIPIQWCMGNAEKLPLTDNTFNLIMCQFGLMLFRDRLSALTEMRRVLQVGGSVVLSVWQDLAHHPFYEAIHRVSKRHLGSSGVENAFSFGDADELLRLMADAGFRSIEITPMSLTVRFSEPEELLQWEIDVDPAEVPSLQNLDSVKQQMILASIQRDLQEEMQDYLRDNLLELTYHANIAVGWR